MDLDHPGQLLSSCIIMRDGHTPARGILDMFPFLWLAKAGKHPEAKGKGYDYNINSHFYRTDQSSGYIQKSTGSHSFQVKNTVSPPCIIMNKLSINFDGQCFKIESK